MVDREFPLAFPANDRIIAMIERITFVIWLRQWMLLDSYG